MTSGPRQQYELLDSSVDHPHQQTDQLIDPDDERTNKNRNFDAKNNGKSKQWSPSIPLRTASPHRVEDSTRAGLAILIWTVCSHLLVSVILIGTIVLGATKRTYSINDNASFLGISFSVDNQMFFYGLFNKVADYVLNDSIARISGVLLTVWMSRSTRFPGVLPLDFDLSEEMSKPWRAIINATHRWRLDPMGNKWAFVFRLLATFGSGCTVLLLGGSFNVVAMPKLRWTGRPTFGGDTSKGIKVEAPTMRIDNINWSHLGSTYSRLGATTASSSSYPPSVAAVAALATLDLLADLVHSIDMGSRLADNITHRGPGFVNIYTIQRARQTQWDVDFTAPPLAVRGRGLTMANLSTEAVISTISIQEGPLFDFWTNGSTSHYGSNALGARNWFNFTLPVLSTTCVDDNTTDSQDIITAPKNAASTFKLNVPGTNTSNPVSCDISVQQTVFPIYVYNSTQDARDEINTPISNPETFIKYLPYIDQNAAIASSLSGILNATLPYLELLTGTSLPTILNTVTTTAISDNNITTYTPSHTAAMTYILGTLSQHLITIATWEESDSGARHLVGPVEYQLYGSGPRLDWQWTIAIVLGLALLILTYDAFLLFYRRVVPGPWLDVPGMMVAANSAPSLMVGKGGGNTADDEELEKWRVGEVTGEVERTKYVLGRDEDGRVEICRLDVKRRKGFGVA